MKNCNEEKRDTLFGDMEVIIGVRKRYNLTNEETFDIFIASALDNDERKGKYKFPFIPNLPIDVGGNYSREWQYFHDKYGYTSFYQEM